MEYSNVVLVDIDIKLHSELLKKFIETRKLILNFLGYAVTKINYTETDKGMHFWFHLAKPVDKYTLWELQFLLGDDHNRVRYNLMRLELDTFDKFNVLFNKKKRYKRKRKK